MFLMIVIFLISSIFRLTNLSLIEFKFDEAFTVFQMTQFFAHPYLMQTGPIQSTGIYNPPLFNYLMTFISLFSRQPQYLSFVIALINTIFIVIFYRVIRKFLGNLVAIPASLAVALSPWSVIFSRKIWIPDLLFPFIVILINYLLQVFMKKNTKAILPMFIILALLIQLHASGSFLTISIFLVLIIMRVKISWGQVLKGLAIGFIPAIPYIVRELTSTPFCIDCVAFLNYQSLPKSFDFNNLLRIFHLNNGLNFEALLGNDYRTFLGSSPILKIINSLFIVGFLIPLGGAIYIIKAKRQYLFLILLLTLLPLLYLLTRTPSYMHYFAILIPFVSLLYGLSFKFIWESMGNNLGNILAASIFLCFAFLNIFFISSFYRFVSEKQIIDGDYGPIFPVTEKYIEQQTADYLMLPEYPEIKSYAFMFAGSPILHSKLGELFAQSNNPGLAANEFKKALIKN